MSSKILYFGYGSNRSSEMMRAITGRKDLKGRPAVLKGYELHVQRLDQVPDTVVAGGHLPISPRALLRKSWDESFESYIIKPGEGEVEGTLWELDPLDRDLVGHWELVDLGWYKETKVTVTTRAGQVVEAVTETLGNNQSTDRKVDGKNHPIYLVNRGDILRNAEIRREDHLKRIRQQN